MLATLALALIALAAALAGGAAANIPSPTHRATAQPCAACPLGG